MSTALDKAPKPQAGRYHAGNPEKIRKKSRRRIQQLMKELQLDPSLVHDINSVLFPELLDATTPALAPRKSLGDTAMNQVAVAPRRSLGDGTTDAALCWNQGTVAIDHPSGHPARPSVHESFADSLWEDGDWGSAEEDDGVGGENGNSGHGNLIALDADFGWADCGYDGGIGKAGGADFGGDIGYDYDDDDDDHDADEGEDGSENCEPAINQPKAVAAYAVVNNHDEDENEEEESANDDGESTPESGSVATEYDQEGGNNKG